jgi:protein SCO1/2
MPAGANAALPDNIALIDERGTPLRSGDLLHRGPLILVPVYYRCPDLCPLTAHQLLAAIGGLHLAPESDFTLAFIGILPNESAGDAAAARQTWAAPPEAQLLRVADMSAATRLLSALDIGVGGTPGDSTFRHEALVAILSADGRLSERLVGYDYSARDLELSLVKAAQGKIGTLDDRILLFCTHFDPRTGRHTGVVLAGLQLTAVLGLLALAVFVRRLTR